MRAKYVVAADGNRSPVRERLGIGMRGHGLLSTASRSTSAPTLGPLRGREDQGVHYVLNP